MQATFVKRTIIGSTPDGMAAAVEKWLTWQDEGFMLPFVTVRQADGAFGFHAEEKHANLIGVVHGGMLMSLADRALGVAPSSLALAWVLAYAVTHVRVVDAARETASLGEGLEAYPLDITDSAAVEQAAKTRALAADAEAIEAPWVWASDQPMPMLPPVAV